MSLNGCVHFDNLLILISILYNVRLLVRYSHFYTIEIKDIQQSLPWAPGRRLSFLCWGAFTAQYFYSAQVEVPSGIGKIHAVGLIQRKSLCTIGCKNDSLRHAFLMQKLIFSEKGKFWKRSRSQSLNGRPVWENSSASNSQEITPLSQQAKSRKWCCAIPPS